MVMQLSEYSKEKIKDKNKSMNCEEKKCCWFSYHTSDFKSYSPAYSALNGEDSDFEGGRLDLKGVPSNKDMLCQEAPHFYDDFSKRYPQASVTTPHN